MKLGTIQYPELYIDQAATPKSGIAFTLDALIRLNGFTYTKTLRASFSEGELLSELARLKEERNKGNVPFNTQTDVWKDFVASL